MGGRGKLIQTDKITLLYEGRDFLGREMKIRKDEKNQLAQIDIWKLINLSFLVACLQQEVFVNIFKLWHPTCEMRYCFQVSMTHNTFKTPRKWIANGLRFIIIILSITVLPPVKCPPSYKFVLK